MDKCEEATPRLDISRCCDRLLHRAIITVFFMYDTLFFDAFGTFPPVASGFGAWCIVHKPVATSVDMNNPAAHY
jgi:hypothetical protein